MHVDWERKGREPGLEAMRFWVSSLCYNLLLPSGQGLSAQAGSRPYYVCLMMEHTSRDWWVLHHLVHDGELTLPGNLVACG